jgi:hypothetical protein
MVAVAERRARPKAERFDRPLRDGRVFLHHFPALRTGLLSPSPSGTSSHRTILSTYVDAYGIARKSHAPYASARLLRLAVLTRRPASEGVAVDDQDSHCDNEDKSGINA